MATWKGGFDGTLFSREEVARYINKQTGLGWAKFLVVHNTGAPNMKQEDATPDRDKDGTGEDDRIQNIAPYYKKQGWSGGPNFFVFNSGKVGLGTPLPYAGTHSPSWNGISIGVEMVADFRTGVDDPYKGGGLVITDTTAYLFATLLKKLGLPANNDTIRLHKEDKKTTHACPGNLFKKDDFVRRVQGYMDGAVPLPLPQTPTPAVKYWVNTPGDTLNFRAEPAGRVKGMLPHGTEVVPLEVDGDWTKVKTPGGYIGWVYAKYLAVKKVETPAPVVPVPLPAPLPETPQEGTMPPGSYKFSPFCKEWAKRFEGYRDKAYWDVSGWAIGWGHNSISGIPPIPHEGSTITKAEAEAALDKDLALQLHYLEAYVDVPLTQGWVDALVLHIFQQGPGNFRNGPVRPLVNAQKWNEAAARIKQGIGKNANLLRRRDVESQIALGGKPSKW